MAHVSSQKQWRRAPAEILTSFKPFPTPLPQSCTVYRFYSKGIVSGVLLRNKRGFNGNQVGGFNNGFNGFNSGFNNNNNNGFGNQFGLNLPLQSGFNGQSEGQRIRESMDIDIERPRVNVNKNTGATSSSSITNAALVNRGKGGPNLKLGQGLGVAISIQGPKDRPRTALSPTRPSSTLMITIPETPSLMLETPEAECREPKLVARSTYTTTAVD